jgi:hypothetical protein
MNFDNKSKPSSMDSLFKTVQGGGGNRARRAEGGPTVSKKPMVGQDGHGRRRSGVEEMPHPVTRGEMMESWNKAGKKPSPDIQTKIDKMPNYKKGGSTKRQKHDFGGTALNAMDKFNSAQNGILHMIPGVNKFFSEGGPAKKMKSFKSGPIDTKEPTKVKARGKVPNKFSTGGKATPSIDNTDPTKPKEISATMPGKRQKHGIGEWVRGAADTVKKAGQSAIDSVSDVGKKAVNTASHIKPFKKGGKTRMCKAVGGVGKARHEYPMEQ